MSDNKEPSWIFEFWLTVDQFLGYILTYLIISTFWMCLGSFYGLFYVPDFIKTCWIWTSRLWTFYQRFTEEGYCQGLLDTSTFNK